MKRFLKSILILTMILCFVIPVFAVKILPYNMPLHDIMSWDERSATLKIANPEGESVSVAWASTVDLWNYDGTTWKFDLPSGNTFEFGKQVTLGTSGSPFSFTYADKVLSVYTTCASTNGSTTANPVYINSIYTGAGQVGRCIEANLETNVAMGVWLNAIKGYTEFTGTSGRTTGLASAVCAEMLLPNATLSSGVYAPLELEWVGQASTNTSGGTSVYTTLIYANVGGGTATDFDARGYFFSLQGLTGATTAVLYNNTLKCLIGTTKWYLPLSSDEGSYTSAYPIALTNTLTVGVSDTGYDVKFWGATANNYILYDQSEDELVVVRTDRGVSLTSFTDSCKIKYDMNTATTGDTSITSIYGHTTINANYNGTGGMSAVWGSTTLNTGKTWTNTSGDLAGGHFSVDFPSGAIIDTGSWAVGVSVGGNLGGTHTGKAAAFRVRAPSAGAWDSLIDIPTALSKTGIANGTCVQVTCSINGTLYYINMYPTQN